MKHVTTHLHAWILVAGLVATIALWPGTDSYAAASPDTSDATTSGATISETTTPQLQEVVVTAEKRESTVQSTPMSITAVSGETLAAEGIANMLDLAQQTPGVSFRTSGPGQTEFEMRGMSSSGGATATVGYYLDDIPISPPALGDIGKVVIDPDLFDLNRVEVLRGPQGTLYGAGSEGGTIRLITNPAKLDTWASTTQVDASETARGGGMNWGVDAMLNAPLISHIAAARLVVSSHYTDGWISRIVVNPFPFPTNNGCAPTAFVGCARGDVAAGPYQQVIPRVNNSRMDSARLSFLIQPNARLEIIPMLMYEVITAGGPNTIDVPPGTSAPLAHYQPFDTPEPMEDYVRLSNLHVSYKFDGAELTSASSYWDRNLRQYQEISEAFENLYGAPEFFPNEGTRETDAMQQYSEELRLASTGNAPFQWLVGAFYSDLDYLWDQVSIDPALTDYVYSTGLYAPVTAADNPNGLIYVASIPYKLKQYAGFTQLSYRLSPSWKATVGARYFRYQTDVHATQAGIFTQSVSATPTIVNSNASANGSSPMVNLSYIPSDDLTLYGTVAKGFRPGGVNLPLPSAGPNDCTAALQGIGVNSQTNSYGADSVWSYEAGEKSLLDDGRISVNSSLYYVKWNDIQQLIPLSCGYFFTVNAGQARSYGSEIEFQANLSHGWLVHLNGGYTNAAINDPLPSLGLRPGTPVLNVPKYTGAASLDYTRALGESLSLKGYLSASYTGALTDESYTYVNLPGYTLLDARLGVAAAKWAVYLSATNLTNKIAFLTENNTAITFNVPDFSRVTINQPRTIGLTLDTYF